MNKRITALLLVIMATLLGWMQYQAKDETNGLDNLIKKEGMPDYTGNRMSTSVFDLEGKPEYYAEAEEIKRYEESEKTEFTNPLVNLFDKLTALKQWKLSADHAEINAERILTLSGNVTLQALEPTSKLQRIETDHLSVNLTNTKFSSITTIGTFTLLPTLYSFAASFQGEIVNCFILPPNFLSVFSKLITLNSTLSPTLYSCNSLLSQANSFL